MLVKKCEQCGRLFKAERKTAKYCAVRCRTAAVRARKALADIPQRREGAALVAIPPKPKTEEGFAAETRTELEKAGRLDTYLGRSAVYLARLLDGGANDTLAGHASVIREYKSTMAQALEGANAEADPLEQILARRRSA